MYIYSTDRALIEIKQRLAADRTDCRYLQKPISFKKHTDCYLVVHFRYRYNMNHFTKCFSVRETIKITINFYGIVNIYFYTSFLPQLRTANSINHRR